MSGNVHTAQHHMPSRAVAETSGPRGRFLHEFGPSVRIGSKSFDFCYRGGERDANTTFPNHPKGFALPFAPPNIEAAQIIIITMPGRVEGKPTIDSDG